MANHWEDAPSIVLEARKTAATWLPSRATTSPCRLPVKIIAQTRSGNLSYSYLIHFWKICSKRSAWTALYPAAKFSQQIGLRCFHCDFDEFADAFDETTILIERNNGRQHAGHVFWPTIGTWRTCAVPKPTTAFSKSVRSRPVQDRSLKYFWVDIPVIQDLCQWDIACSEAPMPRLDCMDWQVRRQTDLPCFSNHTIIDRKQFNLICNAMYEWILGWKWQ